MFKDFLGRKVDVGDYIFYSTTGRYPTSRLCKVSRFTEKSMFAQVIKQNTFGSPDEEVIVRNAFIKVEYSE